ncbi:MAG: acetyl-CoA C-acetyltransferase [Chloroflexi bacterium]|nr:acetyl-CoA C-acetyltransferase [Chloroflexota bacterium]
MNEVVIVDAIRTPIGRYGGALKDVRPDDLAALVISKLMERNQVNPDDIEDVFFGCTNQAGEDNRNVARMAVLLSGLPHTVPGTTVNRLCGSALQAVNSAAQAIQTGNGDIIIAGGVESMTRSPFVMPKPAEGFPRGEMTLYDSTIGWRMTNPKMVEKYPPLSMGETAENVAEKFRLTREEQDEFALLSQQKAVAAIREGKFKAEIVPVPIPQKKGEPLMFDTDEHPRADTTIEKLRALKPAFKSGGTVTAGNSSGINDGAAAVLLMSRQKVTELGVKPMAKIIATGVAGVHPSYMGIGPIPATRKALQRAGLTIDQIDLIELNEAFASQALACMRELGMRTDNVNLNGGAIALGHPLGCTGARILTTLVHEMTRRDARYGLATMCIGVGQGIATIVEREG